MRPQLRTKRELFVEPVGLEVAQLPRPVSGRALFGNDNPLELEIGVGKGTFLTEQAKSRPGVNFLGLEHARRFWQYAADRLRRNGCSNVKVILADASRFLTEEVKEDTFSAIHIYFPDPWPKKRHHKRRLLRHPFVAELARVLLPGGRLQIVTDHGEYHEQIERVVRASTLKPADFVPPGATAPGELVGTNFERRYRREGRCLFLLAAVK